MSKAATWLRAKLDTKEPRKESKLGQKSAAYARASRGYLLKNDHERTRNDLAVSDSLKNTNLSGDSSLKSSHQKKPSARAGKGVLASRKLKATAKNVIKQHDNSPQAALTWAIEKKDQVATDALLEYGIHDASGKGLHRCILHSAKSDDKTLTGRLLTTAKLSDHLAPLLNDAEILYIVEAQVEEDHICMLVRQVDRGKLGSIMTTAVMNNKSKIVMSLVAADVDPNTLFYGHSVLPFAVWCKSKDTISALLQNDKVDVNARAHMHAQDRLMQPALIASIRTRNFDITRLLLACPRTDIHAPNETGNAAHHVAARLGDATALELLFGHGANVNRMNARGQKAIDIAAENGHQDTYNVCRRWARLPPKELPVRKAVSALSTTQGACSVENPSSLGQNSQYTPWPDQVVRARNTTERIILPPSEPSYWN